MPELGVPPEKTVFISGIGCAGRFVYYMDTYGMHGIHGRAPALATGIATARDDLSVWVVTGDGDSLSIGGNHLIHALRRNVPIKILLFNNQIYGLTKGQYSPTSEKGKITKSTPFGSEDHPFNPLALALGAEASFVARTIDVEKKHVAATLRAAAEHEGVGLRRDLPELQRLQRRRLRRRARQGRRARTRSASSTASRSASAPRTSAASIRAADGSLDGRRRRRGRRGRRSSSTTPTSRTRATRPPWRASPKRPNGPTPIGVLRDVKRPVYGAGRQQELAPAHAGASLADVDELLRSGDTWTVS